MAEMNNNYYAGNSEILREEMKMNNIINGVSLVDGLEVAVTGRKRLSAISDRDELRETEMSPIGLDTQVSCNLTPDLNTQDIKLSQQNNLSQNFKIPLKSHTVNFYKLDEEKLSREKNSDGKYPKLYDANTGRPLVRSISQIQRMKMLRIPRDSSFRRLARQISGEGKQVEDVVDGGEPGNRPRTYFDLALVTMCCCMSPLGFIAVIMAVLGDANYKAGHRSKSWRYSKLALSFSIIGMITSVALAITLLLVLKSPWRETSYP